MALTGQATYEMMTQDVLLEETEEQEALTAIRSIKGQTVTPRVNDAFDALKYMRSLRPLSVADERWIHNKINQTESLLEEESSPTQFIQPEELSYESADDTSYDIGYEPEEAPGWKIEAKQNIFAYASAKLMKYEAFLEQMADKRNHY